MPRRAGLPEHIRAELPTRARAGLGLDPDYPTRIGASTCAAATACRHKPSRDMLDFAKRIVDYLYAHDAQFVNVVQDFRDKGQPGALLIRWAGPISAADVATVFAVSHAPCGTPRLPAWLRLRVDEDFDMRWQPAY